MKHSEMCGACDSGYESRCVKTSSCVRARRIADAAAKAARKELSVDFVRLLRSAGIAIDGDRIVLPMTSADVCEGVDPVTRLCLALSQVTETFLKATKEARADAEF